MVSNRTTVVADAGLAMTASAPSGALTTVQPLVSVPVGWASSVTDPMSRTWPGWSNAGSWYAVTFGAALVDGGASTPVAKAWISLRPVRKPAACLTVTRSRSACTAGSCTWLRLARE